ncbi:unnamed protein product [Thlaspi arvense]|uniref:RING-type E3 ubiquitin transferase n=1 Tax=Thlaspi arvense TaxID=13288 RepID=A0AAU9RND8_THLAR|nr:unnamed protein product [Thlaspi arvense]
MNMMKMKPSTLEKRKLKAKMKEITNNDEATSSCSSSSTSNLNSTRRVSRVSHRLRNHTVRLGMARRSVGERQAEALALPLGMSFAAFANLVLERKSAAGQNVYVDDLAVISASAVKESLANVYGNKLGSFATNFEKSFNSTLRILKLINESAYPREFDNSNVGSYNLDRSTIDGCSDSERSAKETSSATSAYEAIQGNARTTTSSMNEIVLHEEIRQLSGFPRSSAMSLTTVERSLEEQARANDLKSMEIGLTMRKLRLKETELALSYESNNLGKSKLEMGVSKAAFRAEKFKTELEDSRKTEMVTRIMDWLGLSVFIMLSSMLYGAWIFSQQRIMEATSLCQPSEEKNSSWWVPKQVSSFNTDLNIFICRLRVWVQIFFGGLMILVFTYFIIQRSSGGTKQTMPVTFIVLFLGIVCGLPGKFCVDTLGGNGKHWLVLWEMFCLLQFVANVFTLALYDLMYGPITVTQGTKSSRCNSKVPYWARRIFLGVILLALPVVNGLLPFATVGEWRDHFMYKYLGVSGTMSDAPSDADAAASHWCYHCNKRVDVETMDDLVVCCECNKGFVESIQPIPAAYSSSTAPLSPDLTVDDSSIGSHFLQMLRLLAHAPSQRSPPPQLDIFPITTRSRTGRNRILDWAEILMGIEDNSIEFRMETDRYTGNPGDYVDDAAGYEALLQNLAEGDGTGGGRRGAPPAAKSAIEALETFEVEKEGEGEGEMMTVVCAVCKEAMVMGEIGKKLPCGHCYHGNCIVPWLGTRNSCPVCRFQLQTDDAEYEEERKKRTVSTLTDSAASASSSSSSATRL